MRPKLELRGMTAVITGAASGIGRGIAMALAARGCHLVLADVDEAGLKETARLVTRADVKVSGHHLDVADESAIAAFVTTVASERGAIELLFNNAGVAVGGTFEQVSAENFDWLMQINFWGVVRMTRAFLPMLRTRNEARIVNISSIFGLVAPPGQAAYVASKFAVRGFSESLRHELEKDSSIGVTVVHPGGVATAIARNARVPANAPDEEVEAGRRRIESKLRMPPEEAGEIIVAAVERRKSRVLVGSDAKLVALIERISPVAYWGLLSRMMS